MNIRPLSLSDFIRHVRDMDGFAYARFSDGAFQCMRNPVGMNCDGVVYTKEQRQSLLEALRDEEITHGITPIAVSTSNPQEILDKNGIRVDWYDADTLNVESEAGTLFPFVHVLRKRKVMLVGPSHLRRFKAFPVEVFVEAHSTRAFEELSTTWPLILELVDHHGVEVILLSIGPAAPVLVSTLHPLIPNVVILDCGSIWDPYVGMMSRSGHKRRGWGGAEELGGLNFGLDISGWRIDA